MSSSSISDTMKSRCQTLSVRFLSLSFWFCFSSCWLHFGAGFSLWWQRCHHASLVPSKKGGGLIFSNSSNKGTKANYFWYILGHESLPESVIVTWKMECSYWLIWNTCSLPVLGGWCRIGSAHLITWPGGWKGASSLVGANLQRGLDVVSYKTSNGL